MLGIYLAVRHFRHFVQGRVFAPYTDHKPLTYTFGRSGSLYTTQKNRQLALVYEFTTEIRHIKGMDNIPAHMLSHIDAFSTQPPPVLDTNLLARLQSDGAELQHYKTTSTALKPEDIVFPETS